MTTQVDAAGAERKRKAEEATSSISAAAARPRIDAPPKVSPKEALQVGDREQRSSLQPSPRPACAVCTI
jgi:hypothetical protein